jgi:non-homologous end joining protein Ku
MLRVADHIIATKTGDFDISLLEDRYRSALVSMLKEKQAAQLPRTAARKADRSDKNVIDLMDILRRSLDAERPAQQVSTSKPPLSATAPLKPPPPKASRRSAETPKRTMTTKYFRRKPGG